MIMIAPMTIDDVTALEAELPKIKVPFGPSDPSELLERLDSAGQTDTSSILAFRKVESETARNLARAAREGGARNGRIHLQVAGKWRAAC